MTNTGKVIGIVNICRNAGAAVLKAFPRGFYKGPASLEIISVSPKQQNSILLRV